MQLIYLQGIMQFLGIVFEWSVHQGYEEPLKLATQFRFQACNKILLNMKDIIKERVHPVLASLRVTFLESPFITLMTYS